MYPLLQQHLASSVDQVVAYLLLYHESAVANLLEVGSCTDRPQPHACIHVHVAILISYGGSIIQDSSASRAGQPSPLPPVLLLIRHQQLHVSTASHDAGDDSELRAGDARRWCCTTSRRARPPAMTRCWSWRTGATASCSTLTGTPAGMHSTKVRPACWHARPRLHSHCLLQEAL